MNSLWFFYQPYPELWNGKSVFLILKIYQCGASMRWVQRFPRYNISRWYLHIHKTYGHKIWQIGAPRRVDSSETNQAGASDVITWRSRGKLKSFYLHCQSAYGHQTWQDCNSPWWAPAQKSRITLRSLDLAKSREKLKQLHLHYHSAHGDQTWQDGD